MLPKEWTANGLPSWDQANTADLMYFALDSREDMLKGFEHGADDYLTKPFDLNILGDQDEHAGSDRYRGKVASSGYPVGELTIDQKS